MPNRLSRFFNQHRPWVEIQLREHLPQSTLAGTGRLNAALRYALDCGGKRLRPLLTVLAGRLVGASPAALARPACGVEFLHLSWLILDDMPAMDDAATRRHVPTVHVVFGEAVAILAAVALFTCAFECFAAAPGLVDEGARAVGVEGMTGGQAADLDGNARSRFKKTTALLCLTLKAGAMCGRPTSDQLAVLDLYGDYTGEAYQICDDLADVLLPQAQAGKPAGQDRRHGRNALGPDFWVDAALVRLRQLSAKAVQAIQEVFGSDPNAELLSEFAAGLAVRGAELVHGYAAGGGDRGAAGCGGDERNALARGAGDNGGAESARFRPDPGEK